VPTSASLNWRPSAGPNSRRAARSITANSGAVSSALARASPSAEKTGRPGGTPRIMTGRVAPRGDCQRAYPSNSQLTCSTPGRPAAWYTRLRGNGRECAKRWVCVERRSTSKSSASYTSDAVRSARLRNPSCKNTNTTAKVTPATAATVRTL